MGPRRNCSPSVARVLPWAFAAPLCAGRPRSHSEDPVPSLHSRGAAGSRPPLLTLLAGGTLVSWPPGAPASPQQCGRGQRFPKSPPRGEARWRPAPADPRAQVIRVQVLALSKQLPPLPLLHPLAPRHVPCHHPGPAPLSQPIPQPPSQNGARGACGGWAWHGFPKMTGPTSSTTAESRESPARAMAHRAPPRHPAVTAPPPDRTSERAAWAPHLPRGPHPALT